jgi:REDY-like protein HapK
MPRIVRYVLAKMKPGVSREDYERFEREVDYALCTQIKSIVSYRTHRITEVGEKLGPVGWDYIERIEITDRAAYDEELAEKGKLFLEELYSKYLDRSYTTSIWSELVEP